MPDRHRAIHAIAQHLLDERLDDLTTTALARLQTEEDAYVGLADDNPAGKRAGMRRTLELALARLAGGPIAPHVQRATEDVGRQRAEEGFPLPALIHSFQLDLRTLWEAVLAEARLRGLGADQEFWDDLILVWEATDKNSVEVVDAYRRSERDLADRNGELRARAFARLVLDGERDPAAVAEAASFFDIAPDAALVAVVAVGVASDDAVLSRCRQTLQRSGLRFHLGWMSNELVGFVEPGRRGDDEVRELLSPLAEWPAGLAGYQGLSGTARALRLARAAMRSSLEPGLRPVHDHWVASVVSGRDELSAAMAVEVLTPLLRLRDRDGILETLRSYLATGSIAGVAAETYRHRNTVRNRLRVVEETSGLDLSHPNSTALLCMAVAWLDTAAGVEFLSSWG